MAALWGASRLVGFQSGGIVEGWQVFKVAALWRASRLSKWWHCGGLVGFQSGGIVEG